MLFLERQQLASMIAPQLLKIIHAIAFTNLSKDVDSRGRLFRIDDAHKHKVEYSLEIICSFFIFYIWSLFCDLSEHRPLRL